MGCKLHGSEPPPSPGVLTKRCKAGPQLPAPFTDAAKQELHRFGERDMKMGLEKNPPGPHAGCKVQLRSGAGATPPLPPLPPRPLGLRSAAGCGEARPGLLCSLSLPASGVAQRLVSGAGWRSEKGCGQLSGPVQLEPQRPGRALDTGGQVRPPREGFETAPLGSAQPSPIARGGSASCPACAHLAAFCRVPFVPIALLGRCQRPEQGAWFVWEIGQKCFIPNQAPRAKQLLKILLRARGVASWHLTLAL